MSMSPTPLLSATVSLVLEYIAPPSLLSPLPPYLISPALAQRHHFLALSPDEPAQYLSWPSDAEPDAQYTAIHLLETFSKSVDNCVYSIRYTSDDDSAFAHVAIDTRNPPGARLVFQWDPSSDCWKFHNLALMPFPNDSHDSISAPAAYEPEDFLNEPPSITIEDDDERDSYWDAYGLADDVEDDAQYGRPKKESEASGEDAYWAQYATVHGSGDSTLPTPPIINQKQEQERIIIAYPTQGTSSNYNPLEPPSPFELAHRLADLCPCTPSPPLVEESDSGSGSDDISPISPMSKSSPQSLPADLPPVSISPSPLKDAPTIFPIAAPASSIKAASEEALKDTVRSLYRLWRANVALDPPPIQYNDCDKFLNIVQQALAELQS